MSKVLTVAPPGAAASAPVPFPGTVAESLALVVAPSTGRFRPCAAPVQGRAGELLGHVTGGRGRADEVRLPVDGCVRAVLVRPGQVVRQGQSLAWLERSADGVEPATEGSEMTGQLTARRAER